jgi:AraC-like DNA-binding protein
MCAGETTHIVNDYVEIKLKCGELLLLNRKAAHEILPCGKDDILVNFIILPEFFIQVFSLVGESSLLFDFIFAHGKADDTGYLHFSAGNILPVQNLVESMIWSIINKVNYSQSVMQGSMGLLILHILNYTDKINQNNPHSYERNIVIGLLKYLESDFQNANLEEYAKKHHISSYTLSKMIKKYTGRNYVTLLQEIRMLEAEKYLTQTDMTVESISSEVGYENNGYFYKLFKERNGMTPFEYRRQKSGNWNIGETEVDSLPKRVW